MTAGRLLAALAALLIPALPLAAGDVPAAASAPAPVREEIRLWPGTPPG